MTSIRLNYYQIRAAFIRSNPSSSVFLEQPKFSRTNPSPPGPNSFPSFRATLAFFRKNSCGMQINLPDLTRSLQSSQTSYATSRTAILTPLNSVFTQSTRKSRFPVTGCTP